jgi:hypothetical protein
LISSFQFHLAICHSKEHPIAMMRRSKATALFLVLTAANSNPLFLAVADNPSGTCAAEDNGGREGYHSPGPNDTYLPDCSNPLKRELWRVFQQEDGTAYMIPRPDGLGIKYNLCSNDETDIGTPPLVDDTLSSKAEQYGLCDEIVDPSLLNNMDRADALKFANVFHRQLFFVANGDSIDPWVPDTDVLAACATLPDDDSTAAAKMYCERVKGRCNGSGECVDIGIIPSSEAVTQLVPALNEIYGAVSTGDQCVSDDWGATFGCPQAGCADAPQDCDYVFDHYVINDIRDCCAELCYAVDSGGNECSGGSSTLLAHNFCWFLLVLLLPLLAI